MERFHCIHIHCMYLFDESDISTVVFMLGVDVVFYFKL